MGLGYTSKKPLYTDEFFTAIQEHNQHFQSTGGKNNNTIIEIAKLITHWSCRPARQSHSPRVVSSMLHTASRVPALYVSVRHDVAAVPLYLQPVSVTQQINGSTSVAQCSGSVQPLPLADRINEWNSKQCHLMLNSQKKKHTFNTEFSDPNLPTTFTWMNSCTIRYIH